MRKMTTSADSTADSNKGGVTALDVRPLGDLLVWGHQCGHLYVWDLERGVLKALHLEKSSTQVVATRFSPSSAYLATASCDDGLVSIWDAERIEPITQIECGSRVYDVAWNKDSTLIATANGDGVPRVWDPLTGKLVWSDPAKPNDRLPGFHSVVFAGDQQVVFGTSDGRLCAWETETDPAKRDALPFKYGGGLEAFVPEIYALDVSSNGALVVAGANQGGGIRVFPTNGNWPRIVNMKVPRPMAVNDVAFSADGRFLAAACSDGVVRVGALDHSIAALANATEVTFLDQLRAAPNDHAIRLVYADYLEQQNDSIRAEMLRIFAGVTPAETKPEGIDPLWEYWVNPATCAVDKERKMPNREVPEDCLGSFVHRDWTPKAIVSSVAFMPLASTGKIRGRIIVSGHFDGAVRFWWQKPESSFFMQAATLKMNGDQPEIIANEGLGEHEKSGVAWISLFV